MNNNLNINPFFLPPILETPLLEETPIIFVPETPSPSQYFSEPSTPIAANILDVFENKTPLPIESETPTRLIHAKIEIENNDNYQIKTPIAANILDAFENKTSLPIEAVTPIFL